MNHLLQFFFSAQERFSMVCDRCWSGVFDMAAGLLSFGPGLVTNGHHRKNGIWFVGKEPIGFWL